MKSMLNYVYIFIIFISVGKTNVFMSNLDDRSVSPRTSVPRSLLNKYEFVI